MPFCRCFTFLLICGSISWSTIPAMKLTILLFECHRNRSDLVQTCSNQTWPFRCLTFTEVSWSHDSVTAPADAGRCCAAGKRGRQLPGAGEGADCEEDWRSSERGFGGTTAESAEKLPGLHSFWFFGQRNCHQSGVWYWHCGILPTRVSYSQGQSQSFYKPTPKMCATLEKATACCKLRGLEKYSQGGETLLAACWHRPACGPYCSLGTSPSLQWPSLIIFQHLRFWPNHPGWVFQIHQQATSSSEGLH